MPTGKIFLKHNFSSVTGYVIIAIFENSAPLAEIVSKRVTIPAPHSERGDTIDGLNPTMHTAKFYQSSDGVTLETRLLSMSLDASIYNEAQIAQFDYVVDRGDSSGSGSDITWSDPVTNDTQIIDERLAGYTKDQMRFEMRGGVAYRVDEYNLISGGGVELADGTTFSDSGNTYRITLFKIVAQQSNTTGVGDSEFDIRPLSDGDFTGGEVDFDDSFHNKICPVKIGVIGKVVFPSLLSVPNCKVRFQTHSNTIPYFGIQLDSGDTVDFLGETLNVIYIGRGEEIEIRVKDNVMYITLYSGDARMRGRRVWGDKLERNTIFRDGTEYNQDDYPGLMQWIDTLPLGQVVDYTTWASTTLVTIPGTSSTVSVSPYKGLFARDDISGKFKVPDDRDMYIRAMKFTDNSDDANRIVDRPGGYQHDQAGPHNHKAKGNFSQGGYDGGGNDFFRARSGNTFEQQNLIEALLTDESRVKNIGMLPLLYI